MKIISSSISVNGITVKCTVEGIDFEPVIKATRQAKDALLGFSASMARLIDSGCVNFTIPEFRIDPVELKKFKKIEQSLDDLHERCRIVRTNRSYHKPSNDVGNYRRKI